MIALVAVSRASCCGVVNAHWHLGCPFCSVGQLVVSMGLCAHQQGSSSEALVKQPQGWVLWMREWGSRPGEGVLRVWVAGIVLQLGVVQSCQGRWG